MTYDPHIWFQTSARHRMVARLPEGCTSGVTALIENRLRDVESRTDWSEPLKEYWRQEWVFWARGLGEWSAGDHYLRCYAPEEDSRKLTVEQFAAFKKAGGGTYGTIQSSFRGSFVGHTRRREAKVCSRS